MPTDKPQRPDDEFAKRFRQGSRYAFYMRYEGGPKNDESLYNIEDERFVVLDVNPQAINMREPVATSISFTQGGGVIRESRGGIIKSVTVAGTTGFSPLPQGSPLHVGFKNPGAINLPKRSSLVLPVTAESTAVATRSGFYAFHRLRYLFRRYAYELREGDTRATLHYIDTKNDEFWRIEPQEFSMTRSSRKPFSYDYNISFTIIDVSQGPRDEAVTAFGLNVTKNTASGIVQNKNKTARAGTLRRMLELTQTGRNFLVHLAGATERKVQSVIRNANSVTRFFENIHDAYTTVLATPLVLLSQLDNSLAGLAITANNLNADVASIASAGNSLFTQQNNLTEDLNEWYLEFRRLSEYLRSDLKQVWSASTDWNVAQENRKYTTGQAKQGSAISVMQPAAGAVGSPDVNPFMLTSGLSLVTNIGQLSATSAAQTVVVNAGDTIWSLAQKHLGDVNRFIDLVLMNNLQSPYIVSDTARKPSNTIAWGEQILVPIVAGDDSLVSATPSPGLPPTLTSTVSDTGTAYELIDTIFTVNDLPGWIPNQWHGYTVTLTHLGVEYQRVVIGNDKDHLEINVPWPVLPSVGDEYTLELILFIGHRPVTPEVRVFGSDVLLQFLPAAGNSESSEVADLVVGSSRDLSLARGLNNFIQAINIRVRIEQGRLSLHPTFGVQLPVGRPWSDDLGILYKFFLRASILSDPRVQSVSNMQLSLLRDQFSLNASIQPVHVKNSQTVSVTLP